jgi:putative hemolysin
LEEEMLIGFALSTEFVWTDDDDVDDICYHMLLIDTDGDAVIVHNLYL